MFNIVSGLGKKLPRTCFLMSFVKISRRAFFTLHLQILIFQYAKFFQSEQASNRHLINTIWVFLVLFKVLAIQSWEMFKKIKFDH